VARIVRRQRPLVGARAASFRLLHSPCLLRAQLVRETATGRVLRNDRLLVERVVDGFGGSQAMSVRVSAFLLFVDVLA